MNKGIGEVTRNKVRNLITVKFLDDIITYQQHMGRVDHGDHHRLMRTVLSNIATFKKWYKKAFLGLYDFSFLQVFTASNLAVNRP